VVPTPPSEIEIDAQLVRALLHEQHRDLADLPLVAFESGLDNTLFRLGERLVVRLPRRALSAELIEHEQRWLPLIADRLPLPVPVPVRTGVPGAGYPWRWSVVEWSQGIAADLAPADPQQARVLARFLRALHVAAPVEAPRSPYRGVALHVRAAVVEERMRRLHATTALITPRICQIWEEALAAPIDVEPTWLHGDMHARNVLVDAGRYAAVIDWGDMCQGDRATDLAAFWMLGSDRDARRQAMAEYADASVATWQRARGWAVFFGVTLLDTGLVDTPRHAAMGERTLRHLEQES
jgi:aminoglycoside phosphotransferase (APT) family kinase protein